MLGRRLLRRTVVVNTKTDRTFKGVVMSRRGGLVVLRQALMLRADGMRIPLDGDLILERANVDFMQDVTLTSPVEEPTED